MHFSISSTCTIKLNKQCIYLYCFMLMWNSTDASHRSMHNNLNFCWLPSKVRKCGPLSPPLSPPSPEVLIGIY